MRAHGPTASEGIHKPSGACADEAEVLPGAKVECIADGEVENLRTVQRAGFGVKSFASADHFEFAQILA